MKWRPRTFSAVSIGDSDILYNNPEIPWDTHLKSIGTSISVKQQDEKPGHTISSGDESWFSGFEWRGKPSFHKHLKRSFPLVICMWEGPSVLCFKQNGPGAAMIRKKSKFPCRGFMHAHRSYHKMKGCLCPCRDPRKRPRPPLHFRNGPNMHLTTRKPRGVHCFKFWRCLTIF